MNFLNMLLGGSERRKTSKAQRIKKMAAKIQRIEKKRAMDEMEAKLKAKLNKLKAY